MIRVSLFLTTILVCTVFQAQFQFVNLLSEGKIPLDIIKSTHQKVAEDQSNEIQRTDSRKVKKVKKDFLLKSNYMLDELLMSGKVVYGNKVNKLINKVGNSLLTEDNRNKIRFYILKSNSINAFSTNQGMIFITTGLLSRLENEAELAFILAHEIAHYTEKHVINKIIESDKIFSKRKRLKYSSYDDNILKLSKYSKNLELEADSIGYVNYLEKGYGQEYVKSAFEILKYSFLPFENTEISLNEINSKIPLILKLDSIPSIQLEDENDSLSSHPNINLRIDMITKTREYDNGKKYIQLSPLEMDLIINSSKLAEIKLQLENLDYINALNNAFNLSKKYPYEYEFKKLCAQSLYGIAKYSNVNKLTNLFYSHENYLGNIIVLYDLFEKLDNEQINTIAIHYIDKLIINNKDNQLLLDMLSDLVYEMCFIHKKDISVFSKEPNQIDNDSIEFYFHHSILNESSELLKEIFIEENNIVDDYFAAELEYEEFLESMTFRKRTKYIKKQRKKQNKSDVFFTGKIGAEKVVYVDPDYMIVDERKGVRLVNSEKANETYIEQIKRAGKASKLNIDVISPKFFSESNVDIYNDLNTVNGSFNEMLLHAGNDVYGGFVLSSYDELKELRSKYQTDYFAYNGQIVFKRQKKDKVSTLLVSMFTVYLIPAAIIYACTPDYDTYYYNMVLDLSKGRFVTAQFSNTDVKATYGRTCSILYNDMCLLKSNKKK